MLLLLPFIALALPALPIEAWAAPEPIAPLPADFAYIPGPELPLASLSEAGAAAGRADHLGRSHAARPPRLSGRAGDGRRPAACRPVHARAAGPAAARAVDCPEWQAAFERARWAAPDAERVRLLVSDAVPSPLSWGWRSPVILIDPDTLAEPDEADAILAHEVAHIARRDWPVLMLDPRRRRLVLVQPPGLAARARGRAAGRGGRRLRGRARGRAGPLCADPAQPRPRSTAG